MRRSGAFLSAAAIAGLLSGCTRTTDFGPLGDTSGGTTAAAQATGASSGTSETSSGGSSSGSMMMTSSTGTISGTSGGTATGAIPFVDGGYVFCLSPDFPDAGPNGAGWMCQPGTYFCDLFMPGDCLQCRSDADCRNPDLPTYDPGALRCDLDSGVPGYQGFCHQCLGDADCGDGGCDLDQNYLGPPLETVGFETCFAKGQRCDPRGCQSFQRCVWDSGACAATECENDFDCALPPELFCLVDAGRCVECRDDTDCVRLGLAASGAAYCFPQLATCAQGCVSNQDCAGSSLGPTCLPPVAYPFVANHCGCDTDAVCAGNPGGPYCDNDSTDGLFGSCTCRSTSDCPAGEACEISMLSAAGVSAQCGSSCEADADCLVNFFCDPASTCRPRCDPGHLCQGPDPLCDRANLLGQNGQSVATVDAGADAGTTWCYPCLTGSDCPAGLGCGADTSFHCGPCQQDPDCAPGSFCDGNGVCQSGCDSGACPPDQVCGNGACWECLSPLDCPATEGCNDVNRSCGSCTGSLDCAPGEVCAIPLSGVGWGACLQNCDARSCPASRPFCAVLPDLTPDHSYCFGCLQDSDCADAGPGAWCDLSLLDLYGGGTFSCLLPPP